MLWRLNLPNKNRFSRFFVLEKNASRPIFAFSKMISGAHL